MKDNLVNKSRDLVKDLVNDCISRQAAIDALDKEYRCTDQSDDWDGLKTAMLIIENLPSAQPDCSFEIQDILDYLDTVLHPIISPEHWNVYSELHDMISTLPSAQPEIIYCGECKHMMPNGKCRQFADSTIRPSASDFCSAGERKDNG